MFMNEIKYGVYENNISKSRFVHWTAGELPKQLQDCDVLVEEHVTMEAAKKAAGLEP